MVDGWLYRCESAKGEVGSVLLSYLSVAVLMLVLVDRMGGGRVCSRLLLPLRVLLRRVWTVGVSGRVGRGEG